MAYSTIGKINSRCPRKIKTKYSKLGIKTIAFHIAKHKHIHVVVRCVDGITCTGTLFPRSLRPNKLVLYRAQVLINGALIYKGKITKVDRNNIEGIYVGRQQKQSLNRSIAARIIRLQLQARHDHAESQGDHHWEGISTMTGLPHEAVERDLLN